MRLRSALLLALVAACSGSSAAPSLKSGELRVTVDAAARTLTLVRGDGTLLRFPADAFQLGVVGALDESKSYDPYWLEAPPSAFKPPPPDDLEWKSPTALTVQTAEEKRLVVALEYPQAHATLTLSTEGDDEVAAVFEPQVQAGALAWVRLRPRAGKDEAFYGLGEWPDDVNHRGKLRPMQIEVDLEVESSSTENHVAVPLLIGTHGWGLFVESQRAGLFDVARKEDDLVEVTYAAQDPKGLRFHLYGAAAPLDVLRHYYAITGAPRLPQPWALGPWIWRNENRDQAEVLDDAKKIRDLDLATSGVWIDRPYASAVNTFDFEPAKFPAPGQMIDALHAAGLRVALWHTPYLENAAQPFRAEADAKGYFPPQAGVLFNKWSKPIDFTNAAAKAFWQQNLHRYTDLGVEGFKLDFAEDVQAGLGGGRNPWRFADGSDERTMLDGYPRLYHAAYAELFAEPTFLLCRAARAGEQTKGLVIWPGDLDATFARHGEKGIDDGKSYVSVGGLPASLAMGLGLSASGFPFYGSDTGGYRHSPPVDDVYIRWFEQTALSSVMQVGDGSSQPPWVQTAENGRDDHALDLYRQYARLHLRLFPYEWTHAQAIARTGRPITRPVGLAYPELGWHPSDAYLFGDDLFVAPVVEAHATTREVTLPPGTWIDWWDGARYAGKATIPAPLERLPLLLRAGGIVPLLRPTIDTLAPATQAGVESFANDAGPLFVRVATGADSAFTVYDGTKLTQGPGKLAIAPGSVFQKGSVFEVLGAAQPQRVHDGADALPRLDGAEAFDAAATGWRWDAATGGTLWVKVAAGAHEVAWE